MHWILIIQIISGYGVTTSTAEFNTKPACVNAATDISKEGGLTKTVHAKCYPKG